MRDFDFKPRPHRARRFPGLRHLPVFAVVLSGITGVTLLMSGQDNAEAIPNSASAVANLEEVPLSVPAASDAETAPAPENATAQTATEAPSSAAEPPPDWRQVTIRSGDTLAKLFSQQGLDAKTMYQVLNAGDAAKSLLRIFPGEEIGFLIDDAGQLQALRYAVDESVTLHVERQGDGFETKLVANPLERRIAHAHGTIDSNLFTAGKAAGLSDGLIMELANIFAWDVDFALDIRPGDRFTVIYEELYRNGEKVRNGGIVAAEFVNQGRTYRAVAYAEDGGKPQFYTPEGKSMRKAFLRTPVDFRRISSNFNPSRLHPILGVKRPHMGVDYAAAPGTPIRAAGSGKVVHVGWKGGYGRTVILQHGTRYSTLYAHMSRFANGLKAGDKVQQGQIIGYVGSSGLASGPHLHYEFRVDGVHRNPLTVTFPDAEPISKKLLADFLEKTGPLVAQLDMISRSQVAQSE